MAIYNGKKITKPNTCELGLYRIKDLPIGEYVKRADLCRTCKGSGKIDVYPYGMDCPECDGKGYIKVHPTVYIRGRFDAFNRRYPLTKFDDINTEVLKSGPALVLAGFTF